MVTVPSQGVVLAAGVGSRLRPLTDSLPKALVPFFGWPLLDLSVAKLRAAGVTRVAVNAFHHAALVERHVHETLAPRHRSIAFTVVTEPELLGTGGALKNLSSWLRGERFWVVNADVVFDEDLRSVAATHAARGCDATLLVTRTCELELRRLVLEDGDVRALIEPYHPDGVAFCGVQIAEPSLLDLLPEGPACNLRDGHIPALSRGHRVTTHETRGYWSDLGTPERLALAHRAAWPVLPRLLGPPTTYLPR